MQQENDTENIAVRHAGESDQARVMWLQNIAAKNAATQAGENDETSAMWELNNAARRVGESDKARAVRCHNNALHTAARRAANCPFHNFGRRYIMPELWWLAHTRSSTVLHSTVHIWRRKRIKWMNEP